MRKKRIYVPSETHKAFYPDSGLITCKCGVKFAPRPDNSDDDPKKCLTCNRKSWSKLWPKPKSKEEVESGAEGKIDTSADVVPIKRRK